jgi:citrate lyase subunit beta/citryl-CoA lyase
MESPVRRRSCLSVPCGSEKMLVKVPTLEADEIVFDLEDGVAEGEKDAARARLLALIGGTSLMQRTIAVRINAVGSPWCHNDVIALGSLGRTGMTLVVPKLLDPDDLGFVERLLLGVERAGNCKNKTGLQGLIETPAGLANISAIAAASARLETLILGYGDLASSLGRDPSLGWGFAQDALVLAARSNGLSAIDGPHFEYSPEALPALDRACVEAVRRGFDGKWAIHPSQVETIDAVFTPTHEEIRRARNIVSLLDAAKAEGRGVTSFDGAMIDEAMREGALRVLSRALGRS